MGREIMDINKLKTHIKLCKRNLKSDRVKCCASCPFEEEIIGAYPELKRLFYLKRDRITNEI